MKRSTFGWFVALVAGMLSWPASAQTVTTYTSLQAWQAAVATRWLISINFQSITQDTYFQTAPLNLGPFSLEQIGKDPTYGLFQNFVDVPPLEFTDNDGNTNAAIFTKFGLNTVNLTFGSPVAAWGANFFGAQTGELLNLVLTTTGGAVVATVPVRVNNGFFGFLVNTGQNLTGITFKSQLSNPDPTIGQGVGLENITGAYSSKPASVPTSQISITASGLAYSRVTQTFNGTFTIKNVSSAAISGPFHILFTSIPNGITLVNSLGSFSGSPYVSIDLASLTPGQSASISVQFSNPSNAAITMLPVVYSGGFN